MPDNDIPKWLIWARELQAISQSGIHYASNDFDRDRFEKIGRISAAIMANYTQVPLEKWLEEFQEQKGYATPKVAVRGAVFRDHHILLVREILDGHWSMPGGWADLNDPPSKMIEREVLEESGYLVRAEKVIAVRESNHNKPPLSFWHNYKLVFLCNLIGGEARLSIETTEVAFFPPDQLPTLSSMRTSLQDIQEAFHFLDHPQESTLFD